MDYNYGNQILEIGVVKVKKLLNLSKTSINVVLTVVCIALLLVACGRSSNEMTSLDKKYNKLAEKAAEELLECEVADCTWTTVETGNLVYLYSAKNGEENQIQVHYLARFDAEDTPEDEWIELIITLSGKSNFVAEALAVYWDVDAYDASFDESDTFMGFGWSSDGWYNVNMSDEDFETAKQENSDLYNNILDCLDYMIDMLGEPYKDEYKDDAGTYLSVDFFSFSTDKSRYYGEIQYSNFAAEGRITSVYWRHKNPEYLTFNDITTNLGAELNQDATEYTFRSYGFSYRSKKILVQEKDDYLQIVVSNK